MNNAAKLRSIKGKRVYTEANESDADGKVISSNWVLKPNKGTMRERLRGRREGRGRRRKHDDDSISASAALPGDRSPERWLHNVHCRRKHRFLNASMKDGDVWVSPRVH